MNWKLWKVLGLGGGALLFVIFLVYTTSGVTSNLANGEYNTVGLVFLDKFKYLINFVQTTLLSILETIKVVFDFVTTIVTWIYNAVGAIIDFFTFGNSRAYEPASGGFGGGGGGSWFIKGWL